MIREQAENINRSIKEKVLQDVAAIFPVQGRNQRIELESIRIDEAREPDVTNFDTMLKAKHDNGTVAVPVKVALTLTDAAGKRVDRGEFTLIRVPLMTATGAFVVNGTDYYIPTQLRLKAGVYHRQKPDNTFESRFNLERGLNFRVVYDPVSYRMRIVMSGKTMDFINFLRGIGVTDAEMINTYGVDLFKRLSEAATGTPEKEVAKFFDIVHYGEAGDIDRAQWVRNYLAGTLMDSAVNNLTLGKPVDRATPDALLESTKKLVEMAGGKGEEDLTSSIIYKKAFTPDDLLSEAYNKQVSLMKKTLQNRVDRFDKLTQIIPVSYMQKPIDQFFSKSSLSQAIETENPTGMINQLYKVTLTGEGGFGDDRAISELDRSLDPYYLGFLDPVHTPESDKIGVNLFRSLASKLKPGTKELWSTLWNVRERKDEDVTPIQIYEKRVAFPNEGKLEKNRVVWHHDRVKVLHRGRISEVSPDLVDYFIKKPTELFDPTTNLVPFLDSAQGARAMMASKHLSHAIALKDPEKPLVMTEDPQEQPYEYTVGREIAVMAPEDGTVSKIGDRTITLVTPDNRKVEVSMAKNFPTSANFFLDHKPVVKIGDAVKKGDLLADSNYTSDGALSLGKNLRTAYMNYKGFNFEDGIVISESAAKKLTSEHMYVIDKPINDRMVLSKDKFRAYYPTKYTAEQLEKLESNGVVKKGARVKPGDPVILALTQRTRTLNEEILGDLSKQVLRDMKSAEEVWDGPVEGVVVDIVSRPSYLKVYIRTAESMVVGDKMTGRHGNKGTIGAILPDGEMPTTEDGQPLEVIMNPHGITSRINPSQLLELAASKIAEAIGQPVQVAAFELTDNEEPSSRAAELQGLLNDMGIKDKEKIIDPKDGPVEAPTLVGKEYFIKLPQQISKKTSIRKERGYDMDYQPLRGSAEHGASRAVDALTTYALISHGARANMREMATYKAERNDDFWEAVQNGRIPPAPKPTFAFEKFVDYLKAAGINVEKNNGVLRVKPLKAEEALAKSNGEINSASMLSGYNFEPEKGGLFDPQVMGGLEGSKWGHIALADEMPNPTFDDEIRIILDITKTEYDALVKGNIGVDDNGWIVPPDQVKHKHGAAFKKLLENLNIDTTITELEQKAKAETRPDTLNKILRRLRYLHGLKKTGTRPEDLVLKYVPVIPSKLRPVYAVEGEDQIRMADINLLYRDAILVNNSLKDLKEKLPDEELSELYANLYDALKALSGNGQPISQDAIQANASGVLEFVGSSVGSSPKSGFFQGKLLKRRQELSGTGVIQNAPDMDMDEAGVPEKLAFSVYKPFVIRQLQGMGYDPKQIREMLENDDPLARKILEREMESRPVMLNRSPSLHKFNIMAFKPKVVAGDAIKVNPQIVKGFNADFDGDCSINSVFASIPAAALPEHIRYALRGELTEDGRLRVLLNLRDFPREGEPVIDGNKEIYRVPEGVTAVAVQDGRVVELPVESFSVHKNLEMVEVVTSERTTVHCSKDHSLVTVDDELNYVKAEPAIGMVIPRLVRTYTPASPFTAITEEGVIIPLDTGTGYLMGVLVGVGGALDGVKDGGVRARVEELIETIGNKTTLLPKVLLPHVLVEGVPRLPVYWMETDAAFREGLLAGIIDTIGSVVGFPEAPASSIHTDVFCTVYDRSLSYEIVSLATSLGMLASVAIGLRKGRPERYTAVFDPDSVARMRERLPLRCQEKAMTLDRTVVFKGRHFSYCPPLSVERLRELKKAVGVPRIYKKGTKLDDMTSRERKVRRDLFNTLHRVQHGKCKAPTIDMAEKLFTTLPELFRDDPFWARWKAMATDRDIVWEAVADIRPLRHITEAYDLTVPPAYTLVTETGVIIHDTMGIHVPVTEEARKEAYNMLPSANLFKPGTGAPGKLIHGLSLEYISGLYLLTKDVELKGEATNYGAYGDMYRDYLDKNVPYDTTVMFEGVKSSLGKHLINGLLPKEMRKYDSRWTKSEINKAFLQLAKDDPGTYVEVSNKLKELGRIAAYRIGIGMGIEDLVNTGNLKARIMDRIDAAERIEDDDARAKVLTDLAAELEDIIVDEAPNLADENAFYKMFVSGAKGSPGQVKQILEAPIAVADTFGDTVPIPIKRGYAEGLSPAEYWSSLYGARFGMIAKKMMVAEPGALNKEILNTLVEKVVSVAKDDRDPGLPLDIREKTVEGRVLAEDVIRDGKIVAQRDDVLDGNLRKRLLAAGVLTTPMKSPLTSTISEGLAADNFGLDETGHFPKIGDNVGVKSGQALSEPLSQTSMSLFHTGGAAGEDNINIGNVFESIQKAINMPKSLKNAAVLSKKYGTVESIVERPGGGWEVTVAGEVHVIPGYLKLKVDEGSPVVVGQALSTGQVPPRDVLELRGLTSMQDTLVEELKRYLSAMGENITRSTLETLVSGLTQTAQVIDSKDRPGFEAGSVVPVQRITSLGLENKKPVPVDDALGLRLARNYSGTLVHTLITPEIQKELKAGNWNMVEAYEDPVTWQPLIVGAGRQTTVGNDWLHKMTFRYLRKVLPESAIQGDESNIHGYNPLTSWVYGAEMGKGKEGQY